MSGHLFKLFMFMLSLFIFKKRNCAENILNQMISILAEPTFDCISLHFANWQRSKFKEECSKTVT